MSLLDEVAEKLDGKMYQEYFAALCCFHQDSTPSLLINEQYYNCLACGAYGSTKDLIKKLSGITIKSEYHKSPIPWYKLLKNRSVQELADDCYENLLNFPDQIYYLKKRKINKTINLLKLGWIDGIYTFPILDPKKNVIGIIGRYGEANQQETQMRYFTPPGQDGMLYVPDWRFVLASDTIYVTYGIIDSIVLRICGLPSLTWSIGKNLPSEALTQFRKRIIVVPDFGEMDKGGDLVGGLGWRGKLKNIEYPDGCKDPADIYQKMGKEILIKTLTS